MRYNRIKPIIGVMLCALMLAVVFSPRMLALLKLPPQQRMVVGEEEVIQLLLPSWLEHRLELNLNSAQDAAYPAAEDPALVMKRAGELYEISALKPGSAQLTLSLFGYVPVRTVEVQALPHRLAVPGGHSIGVILRSDGIMAVGFAMVETAEGERLYPAREQGVQIGDMIVAVDGAPVRDETELARIIDRRQGEPVSLRIMRDGEQLEIEVQGVYCRETDRFRIGLYVRDSVVGVGTLSFWDPLTGQYAALGHRIEDVDTGQKIDVFEGRLVSASIQAIKAGRSGAPGEKIGVLSERGPVSGDIASNTEVGIFGNTSQEVRNPLYGRSLELAYAHQVREGPAQMLTVINGQDIEAFDIYIKKLYPERQNGKGMVLQVTDSRLISISGGIVQGMSGSPIIQNERIVGVVTHVFLNDPLSGYGVFVDQIMSNAPA